MIGLRLPVLLCTVLLSIAALAAPSTVAGQNAERIRSLAVSDTLYELRMGDGTTYVGQVAAVAGDSITISTATGVRVQFHRAQLSAVRVAEGRLVDGQFWRRDSNRTRLFFAPTARTLDAGDGYAGLFFVLPFVGYGLTDAITLAGGLPLFGGSDGGVPFFYLAPKVKVYSTERTELSGGVLAVFGADSDTDVAGVGYGVGTFGSEDRALTLGAGIPFASGEGAADRFVVMVGGETRVGRRLKLLTENWAIPGESGALLTGGIRLMGERWTTDLGLAAAVGSDGYFYFPIVSFAYAFGGAI